MADLQSVLGPVVELHPEIDLLNAEAVGSRLRSACTSGAVVVADMTNTTFCDSRGTQELLGAHSVRWN